VLEGEISHDEITRFLSRSTFSSSTLWLSVKSAVREIEKSDGVLIFDDTIMEKPHTKENDIVTWHYDHSKGRSVKGINILNAMYSVSDINIPVAFEIINKPIHYCDIKTRKVKHRSELTKNDLLLQMLKTCQQNQLLYSYVLTDIWYASTMQEIKLTFNKDFIMAMKCNLLAALSLEDKHQGRFVRIDSLNLEPNTTQQVYLTGLSYSFN